MGIHKLHLYLYILAGESKSTCSLYMCLLSMRFAGNHIEYIFMFSGSGFYYIEYILYIMCEKMCFYVNFTKLYFYVITYVL